MQVENIRFVFSCTDLLASQLDDIASCPEEATASPHHGKFSQGLLCDAAHGHLGTLATNTTTGSQTISPAVWPSIVVPCQAPVTLLQVVNHSYANQQAISIITMVLLMILGLCGNISVLLVYIPKRMKQMTNYIITVLAAPDLFACSVVHPYII